MKQQWLDLILHLSSLIHRKKTALFYAGLIHTVVLGIQIVFWEIIILVVSIPLYFFIVPEEEKKYFGADSREIKIYRLRKKITIAALIIFLLLQVIRFVLTFSGFVLFPSKGLADGSGTTTVSPILVAASSTGNTFTFTSTAAELMDSGEISINVPAGWSAPQGIIGTAGYTTATSASGIIADVINPLNSATNWTATRHMTLSADTVDKPSEINPVSTASLSNTITATAGANEQWFFNNGAAENWGSIDNEVTGLRVGMFIRSSINTASGDISWQNDDTASLASPLDTTAIPALTANIWTYTSVNLGAISRNSILSYGYRYTTDIGADTIKVDTIAPLFDSAGGTNWAGDANITDSLLTTVGDYKEGNSAIRCTYAAAAGTGTNGDCFRSNMNQVTFGPGTTVGFWVRPSIALNAGDFAWTDDNNNSLGSPEDTVNLPALSANTWTYVTLTAANSANKSSRSWGLRQLVDKGAMTIDIDAMGKVINTADSTTGWSAPTSAVQTLSTDNVVFHEGGTSLKNVITAGASAGDYWYETFASAQDWSNYTTIGLWIRSTAPASAGDLQFQYASSTDLSSPIATLNIGALPADTWSYQKLTLSGSRSSIRSYGIKYATDIGATTIYLDDVLAGPGSPTFPGGGDIRVRLLSLAAVETVVVSYGNGGGSSGVTAPVTSGLHTFITQTRTSDSGTLVNIASSPTITVNIPDASPPAISFIAPTKTSNSTITDTTIQITDNNAITASSVTIDPSTTVGIANFNCTQTNSSTVDCSIHITSSGNLVIAATDNAGNNASHSENNYIIEAVTPTISFTAPTKTSNSTITDTTIQITDNNAITASSVTIDPSTTAGTANFNCSQTNSTTVDCSIHIASSGNLTISATDDAGNTTLHSENNYIIETELPTISFTAPTKTSNSTITDTVIQIIDNNAITTTNATIDASTTAGTANFNCSQTNAATVDCTIDITGSGNLVIAATDNAGNNASHSENNYVIEAVTPAISFIAPTKTSNSTITDTTIQIIDNNAIIASNVTIDPSTTVGIANFNCSQTNAATVDCTIDITGSGSLVIAATDNAGNNASHSENNYIIETVTPAISFTAPTKTSNSTITDTTIQITDNNAITASSVTIDPSTTAGTANFNCSQTNSTTVDCSIHIASSGNLTISATDDAGNTIIATETGYIIGGTASADLAITKTDNNTSAVNGNPIIYSIIVTNNGPSAVNGALIQDTFPSGISGITWTCTASAGSLCQTSGSSGDINTSVDLLSGGTATFITQGTVSLTGGTLSNTAIVTVPIGINDPDPGNNSATDINTVSGTSSSGSTGSGGSGSRSGGGTLPRNIIEGNKPQDTKTPAVSEPLTAASFSDTSDHWAQTYIEQIKTECGVTGYQNPANPELKIFKPDINITRAELLAMAMKCRSEELKEPTEKPFPDIELNEWYTKYIYNAKEKNIISGFEEGLFRPNSFATRAEALKIILLASHSVTEIQSSHFDVSGKCNDVNNNDWFIDFFRFGIQNNIISGYEDEEGRPLSECRPATNITRAEAAKIILTSKNQPTI